MPDLLEHMYCAQQINIPPNLPYILKQYAKAAIRTQPYDLLYWSAAYFRAKANNLPPPVKERLEYPPFDSPSRLSPGFLRVLHKQLENHEYVRVEVLYEKWLGVCLVKEALDSMLKIGAIQHRVPWLKFVAIAAGHTCTSLGKTMVLICEVLTDQPDGGAAWIPVEKFVELYQFLALLHCGPDPPVIKRVELDVPTPSVSSTQVSSSVPEEEAESMEVDEKDSTAGLMVLPDIKPHQKPDRIQTPKADDEPGATSELGVEVYDNAKGPVTELVTLYPAPTETQVRGATRISESPSKVGAKPHETESVDESILSHTSLKENEDWIKVEAKDLDEEGGESDTLDLDKLVSEAASKTELPAKSRTKGEEKSELEGAGELEEDQDKPLETSEDQPKGTTLKDAVSTEDKASRKNGLSKTDDISEKTTEKARTLNETSEEMGSIIGMEAKSEENVEKGTPSQATLDSKEKTEDSGDSGSKKSALKSTDSDYALDESITMTNFVKTREIGYSVVEIRRGRYGDKSLDQIELHEDDGPVASPTVHRLSAESQESVDTQPKETKQPYWEHVPGIGPVISEDQIRAVVEYMQYWASKQQGMVGPRNINHLLCPPLDLPPVPEDDVSMY